MKRVFSAIMIALLVFTTLLILVPQVKGEVSPFRILWRAPIRDVYWENNNGPYGVYPGDLGVDAGDVDGDGIDDIATIPNDWNYGGEGNNNTLQVFKSDGSELWFTSVLIQGGRVAIADVDLDGKGEVFVFGTSTNIDLGWGPPKTTIYAFDHDGTKMWEYIDYEDTGGRLTRWITFTNIDADPELEVIAANRCWLDTFTYALDTDGSLKWRFTGNENNHMLFGDITGDGVEEVITLTNVAHMVYVIDKLTGNLLWSYSTINYNLGVLGDITGDGINDVIVSSGGEELYYGNKLYAFRNDGTLLWSKDYAGGGANAPTIPVVQDIDGDSVKDIIVGVGQKIIAYKSDGTLLWTYGDPSFFNYQTPWLYRFDVDIDGQDEIIFLKGKDVYQISKDGDVSLVGALPVADAWSIKAFDSMGKVTEKTSTETAWLVSGDVNNDGFDELFLHEIIDRQFYVTAITIEYPGEESVIFFDDFESYAVGTFPSAGGWELIWNGRGNEYQCITDKYWHSPIKSLQLWGKDWWSAHVQKKFSSDSTLLGFEAYVLVESYTSKPSGSPVSAVIGFWNKEAATWGLGYAWVQFTYDGNITTNDIWAPTLGTWTPKTWYKVKLILDRSTNTFDVWINGELVGNDIEVLPDRQNTYNINALMLVSNHAGVKVYFDDVKVFVPQVEPLNWEEILKTTELRKQVYTLFYSKFLNSSWWNDVARNKVDAIVDAYNPFADAAETLLDALLEYFLNLNIYGPISLLKSSYDVCAGIINLFQAIYCDEVSWTITGASYSYSLNSRFRELISAVDSVISASKVKDYAMLVNALEKEKAATENLYMGTKSFDDAVYNVLLDNPAWLKETKASLYLTIRGHLVALRSQLESNYAYVTQLLGLWRDLAEEKADGLMNSRYGLPIVVDAYWEVNGQKVYVTKVGETVKAHVIIGTRNFSRIEHDMVDGEIKVIVMKDIRLWFDEEYVSQTFTVTIHPDAEKEVVLSFTPDQASGLLFKGYYLIVRFNGRYIFPNHRLENLIVKWLDGSHEMKNSYPPRLKVEEAGKTSLDSGTAIVLNETQHKLYLHVYDSKGRHVGYNHQTGSVEIGIPDAEYYDNNKGILAIALPANISDFSIKVDAANAQEQTETYALIVVVIENLEIKTQNTLTTTIQQGTSQEYELKIFPDGKIDLNPIKEPIPLHLILLSILVIAGSIIVAIVMLRKRISKHTKHTHLHQNTGIVGIQLPFTT